MIEISDIRRFNVKFGVYFQKIWIFPEFSSFFPIFHGLSLFTPKFSLWICAKLFWHVETDDIIRHVAPCEFDKFWRRIFGNRPKTKMLPVRVIFLWGVRYFDVPTKLRGLIFFHISTCGVLLLTRTKSKRFWHVKNSFKLILTPNN